MRSVSALDVRRRFGEIVDRAAAGERIVIERSGQPIAALVPLADLALVDPDRRVAIRLSALDEIRRMSRRGDRPSVDAGRLINHQRRGRERDIAKRVKR